MFNESSARSHDSYFLCERAASKISDIPKDTLSFQSTLLGLLAQEQWVEELLNFANAGIPVLVLDQDEKNLDRGMGVIEKIIK